MIDFSDHLRRSKDWARISKLVGMLGSEHDGERLNAARLIQATLKGQGKSFGDLAAHINGTPTQIGQRVVVVEKRITPNPAAQMAVSILDHVGGRDGLLSSEFIFLKDIIRKDAVTGGSYNLNRYQADWLVAIEQKYMTQKGPRLKRFKTSRIKEPVEQSLLDAMGLGVPPKPDLDDHLGNFRAKAAGERGEEKVKPDKQTVPHARPGKYRGDFMNDPVDEGDF